MKLKPVRTEQARTQQGACCDRTMGPEVVQITLEDEETGGRFFCCVSGDAGSRELIAANRDVLHAVANLYDEDVIPYRLERYRESRPDEWKQWQGSAFAECFRMLLESRQNA